MKNCILLFFIILLSGCKTVQNEYPQAEITNNYIMAKLYLPDTDRGYYLGSRFDWSGVIFELKYEGHDYFGPWNPIRDPKNHDSISGPVEEFAQIGYEEAPAGGEYLHIGIGGMRKPEEEEFMASSEGQEKIITALFNAFKEYKYAIDGFNNQSEIATAQPDTEKITEPNSAVSKTPVIPEKPIVLGVDTTKNASPKIVYKVQFASSSTDKPLTASEFKNIETPGKYWHQGAFRYTSGEANSMEEIAVTLRQMQNQGYRDAFIVVFKDNQRITTAEALRILQEQN